MQRFLSTRAMNWVLEGDHAEVWGALPAAESGECSAEDAASLGPIAPAPDLIVLKKRTYEDPFSKYLAEKAIYALRLHRFMNPSMVHGLVAFTDKSVLRITSWITTIMAPILCILVTIVLYNIPSMRTRLALIATFNVLGAICLATFTSAKRVEIFAVLAA